MSGAGPGGDHARYWCISRIPSAGVTLMKIPKPTEADRERFTGLVPDAPQVEIKPMFGNLGAFVNGNMFMGLFGPEERPMGGYVAIPADWPAGTAGDWIGKSLAYVAALPPKKPKAAKPR